MAPEEWLELLATVPKLDEALKADYTKDRVRLKLILRGKRMGFSLAETKELFDLWDETLTGNEKQLLKMLEILSARRDQLEQQKEDIAMAEMEMDTAEARCREALTELQKKKEEQGLTTNTKETAVSK